MQWLQNTCLSVTMRVRAREIRRNNMVRLTLAARRLVLVMAKNSVYASYTSGHNDWIKQGFSDGIFLLAGSIETGQGGSVIAHNISLKDLQEKVNADPFVVQNVVTSEIIEISPKKTVDQLSFLME